MFVVKARDVVEPSLWRRNAPIDPGQRWRIGPADIGKCNRAEIVAVGTVIRLKLRDGRKMQRIA